MYCILRMPVSPSPWHHSENKRLIDVTAINTVCMSKERHFSFYNLGRDFASCVKFLQCALVRPFLLPTNPENSSAAPISAALIFFHPSAPYVMTGHTSALTNFTLRSLRSSDSFIFPNCIHGSSLGPSCSCFDEGAVAERVTALDWRPGGPGFESPCGNFTSELWQFRLPRYPALPVSFGGDAIWCLCQGK